MNFEQTQPIDDFDDGIQHVEQYLGVGGGRTPLSRLCKTVFVRVESMESTYVFGCAAKRPLLVGLGSSLPSSTKNKTLSKLS